MVQIIMSLRNQGVRDTGVLEAMEKVPRDLFVPETFRDQAYEDKSLPIDCGQSISQPFVVGLMTDRLQLNDRSKVLEIGTGSGYQTAVLSHLCRRVTTLERYRTLHRQAVKRFEGLHLRNIAAMVADGTKGWPPQAPFERIIVTAATMRVPRALLEQLAVGGIMISPVELSPGRQELQRIVRKESGFETETLMPVRFVPLVKGLAKET